LRKTENDDIDTLKARPIKNSKSLLECPTITALVAAFDAKAFCDTELLKSYLAGGSRIINACRQISRKRYGEMIDKTHGLSFYKFHICSVLSYLCSKNQTHYTYVWRHKVVKAQREDHVATQWRF